MAPVKQELEEDDFSDYNLTLWADPKHDIKDEEADSKPELQNIKMELHQNIRDCENDKINQIVEDKEDNNVGTETNSEKGKENLKKNKPKRQSRSKNVNSSSETQKRKDCLQEAVNKATVSDTVSNQCRYQCPECQEVFKVRNSLIRHFKSSNHVDWSVTSDTTRFPNTYRCSSVSYLLKEDIVRSSDHKKSHDGKSQN